MPSLKSRIGNKEHISLDDVCFLLSVTSSEDELGQQIVTETISALVYCSKLSVSRAEFYAAGQLDYKPALLLVVDSDEYDGENKLEYDRVTYSIYKDFIRPDGLTELYCEVKAGG
jgi:SPP1 family predicted phage head-tail adaptor